ncbi:MAG: hypothetical protein K2M30_05705 [Desulfovibrionaceae bacterium]|nr:hypothetical protein [Desulfovibrionaceae bacterium]
MNSRSTASLIYILICMYTLLLPLHAHSTEEDIIHIDVHDIRMSTSTPYAIEIIATTPQGRRNFILQESIPRDIERYITDKDITSVCKQLLQEIQQGMIDIVWLDQLYAIIDANTRQKNAIRFKYLFVSRLQESLPPDFIDSSHSVADVYGIPPSHNIQSPILPVPAIPDYSDNPLTPEVEKELDNTALARYDMYTDTQHIQAFMGEHDTPASSSHSDINTYTTQSTDKDEQKKRTAQEEHSNKDILTHNSQPSDMEVMYQNTLEQIVDKKKEEIYKKYNDLQKALDSNE